MYIAIHRFTCATKSWAIIRVRVDDDCLFANVKARTKERRKERVNDERKGKNEWYQRACVCVRARE